MDILKPDLMWLEGRCYRINPQHSSFRGDIDDQYSEDEYTDENLDCPVEEPYEDFEIETIGNGRYRTSFHVARCYFPIVIGSKGVVRRRLENETRTQIQVPKQGQDGHIVITGASRSGVEAAHRRVDLIVAAARNRQQFTHFLSIPLNGESVQKRFHQFKEEVLDLCGHSRGISASIFQAPEKLHLTLGTLVIMDAEERERAAQCLTLCKESIVQPLLRGETLAVRMVGVEYMNDDPAEVDILYGKVHVEGNDNSHVLQDLADGIVGHFTSRVRSQVTLILTSSGLVNHLMPLASSSRVTAQHYVVKNWPIRQGYIPGEHNIKYPLLVQREKVLLPSLHKKLGLMKNFVNALDKSGEALQYLKTLFSKTNDVNLKEGIFVCPLFPVQKEFKKKDLTLRNYQHGNLLNLSSKCFLGITRQKIIAN
ncbi:activating signal cointegrator 1 complex subunit 1 isoform X2 [Periplaneta americana]|uniref:activating signal cointegrator 1 complex subunit 1 isoform X2 n=1 Tax=Periplaneta americana TaxID=6978 RepID=UPI0037E90A3D